MRHGARGCCSVEDANDARRSADILGIPFYVWDLAERFRVDVIDDFVAEYAAGRTPNPCLRCNEKIKFAAVLDRALALGFDAVVTGHHARLVDGRLMRSVDVGKDQSYVLAVLTATQLAHAMFPIGDSTKAQVRDEAARRGLAVAASRTRTTSASSPTATPAASCRASSASDPDRSSTPPRRTVVGEHDGSFGFTVGQRRGLHLDRAAADGAARYVLSLEPATNTVLVGPRERLEVTRIVAEHPVWTSGVSPKPPLVCQVQLRAHGMVSDATVTRIR